jgi:hypothetical protein
MVAVGFTVATVAVLENLLPMGDVKTAGKEYLKGFEGNGGRCYGLTLTLRRP